MRLRWGRTRHPSREEPCRAVAVATTKRHAQPSRRHHNHRSLPAAVRARRRNSTTPSEQSCNPPAGIRSVDPGGQCLRVRRRRVLSSRAQARRLVRPALGTPRGRPRSRARIPLAPEPVLVSPPGHQGRPFPPHPPGGAGRRPRPKGRARRAAQAGRPDHRRRTARPGRIRPARPVRWQVPADRVPRVHREAPEPDLSRRPRHIRRRGFRDRRSRQEDWPAHPGRSTTPHRVEPDLDRAVPFRAGLAWADLGRAVPYRRHQLGRSASRRPTPRPRRDRPRRLPRGPAMAAREDRTRVSSPTG